MRVPESATLPIDVADVELVVTITCRNCRGNPPRVEPPGSERGGCGFCQSQGRVLRTVPLSFLRDYHLDRVR